MNSNKQINKVIKGDLNIDIFNNGTDSNNYHNLLNEYGFISLVNCITRTKEMGGFCLYIKLYL